MALLGFILSAVTQNDSEVFPGDVSMPEVACIKKPNHALIHSVRLEWLLESILDDGLEFGQDPGSTRPKASPCLLQVNAVSAFANM